MLNSFLTSIGNLQKLQMIVSNTDSDSVLFVTCELLSKIVQQTLMEPMPAPNVSDMMESQISPNAATVNHFTQLSELFTKILLEKGGKLQNFTINSIANLLGSVVKKIWLDIKEDEMFIQNIKTIFLSQVKVLSFYLTQYRIIPRWKILS